jgi:hypothetical protein
MPQHRAEQPQELAEALRGAVGDQQATAAEQAHAAVDVLRTHAVEHEVETRGLRAADHRIDILGSVVDGRGSERGQERMLGR